jgi:hypothetical protein
MAIISEVFGTVTDPFQINFSWVDVATGTGYVTAYAGTSIDTDAGYEYDLFTTTPEVGDYESSTTARSKITYFDTIDDAGNEFKMSPFNRARTIKGKMYVTYTVVSTDSHTGVSTITVELLNGATSIISDADGGKFTGASTSITYNMILDIPETKFNKDDVLTLKFSRTGTGNSYIFLMHDPLNRDYTGYSTGGAGLGTVPTVTAANNQTKLEVQIPFKI